MIGIQNVTTAKLISVHDEPDWPQIRILTVVPREYVIPPISAKPEEIEARCVTTILSLRSRETQRLQYAALAREVKTPDGGTKKTDPYILLTVPESFCIRQGVSTQMLDEWGRPLYPQVERAYLHISAPEIASEIEREIGTSCRAVVAIAGDLPTEAEIQQAQTRYREWMLNRIHETSAAYTRFGPREVTAQSLRIANRLYQKGLLRIMPTWAMLDPDAKAEGIISCEVCQTPIRKTDVICLKCGAVYNWKEAVNKGIKALHDVPPHKRAEVGLPPLPPELPQPETLAAAAGKSARQ